MKIARIFVASLMAIGVSALAMPPPTQAQTQPSYADQAWSFGGKCSNSSACASITASLPRERPLCRAS